MESDQIKPISEIATRWQAAITLLRLLGLDDKRVFRVEFSAGVDEPSRIKIEYDVTRSGIAEAPQISPDEIEVTTKSSTAKEFEAPEWRQRAGI